MYIYIYIYLYSAVECGVEGMIECSKGGRQHI